MNRKTAAKNPDRKTALFLCSGNYYRSRFAEFLFNWIATTKNLRWRAESRGLQLDPTNVGPISMNTLRRLAALGITVDQKPRPPLLATAADLEEADLIVAVKETEHRPLMQRHFPAWADRVEYWHVHDVDCAEPKDTLDELERNMHALVQRLSVNA